MTAVPATPAAALRAAADHLEVDRHDAVYSLAIAAAGNSRLQSDAAYEFKRATGVSLDAYDSNRSVAETAAKLREVAKEISA